DRHDALPADRLPLRILVGRARATPLARGAARPDDRAVLDALPCAHARPDDRAFLDELPGAHARLADPPPVEGTALGDPPGSAPDLEPARCPGHEIGGPARRDLQLPSPDDLPVVRGARSPGSGAPGSLEGPRREPMANVPPG